MSNPLEIRNAYESVCAVEVVGSVLIPKSVSGWNDSVCDAIISVPAGVVGIAVQRIVGDEAVGEVGSGGERCESDQAGNGYCQFDS